MEKIKIAKIFFNATNKEGQPYLDKKSQPYKVVVIYEEGTERRMSGFAYEDSEVLGWQAGDEVEIEVTQKGQWLNFRIPKPESELEKRVKKLEEAVGNLEAQVIGISISEKDGTGI